MSVSSTSSPYTASSTSPRSTSSTSTSPTATFTPTVDDRNVATWLLDSAAAKANGLALILKLNTTHDFKPLFESACPSSTELAKQCFVFPGKKTHVVKDPRVMKALLDHYRFDSTDIFGWAGEPVDGSVYKLMRMFLPKEQFTRNDVIMSCDADVSVILRKPLFHSKSTVKALSPKIEELVNSTLARLGAVNGPINMSAELKLFTCTVISRIVLGWNPPEELASLKLKTLAKAVDSINTFFIHSTLMVPVDKLRLELAQSNFRAAIDDILANSTAPLVQKIKESEDISPIQQKLLLAALFVAGQETSVTALTELFWQLSVNPAIQAEIAQKLPCRDLINLALGEALRTKPPAYAFTRLVRVPLKLSVTNEDGSTQTHPTTIYPGELISGCPFLAAKDPTLFPNPDKFDPKRHSVDTADWRPFGGGRHLCPGSELFVEEAMEMTAGLLSQFTMTTPQAKKPASKGMMTDHFIEDLQVILTRR